MRRGRLVPGRRRSTLALSRWKQLNVQQGPCRELRVLLREASPGSAIEMGIRLLAGAARSV